MFYFLWTEDDHTSLQRNLLHKGDHRNRVRQCRLEAHCIDNWRLKKRKRFDCKNYSEDVKVLIVAVR